MVTLYQERLLLSVLPAHLAAEMKTEMMERVRDPTQTRSAAPGMQKNSTTHFHNLYVKRHKNVRWAGHRLFFSVFNSLQIISHVSVATWTNLLNLFLSIYHPSSMQFRDVAGFMRFETDMRSAHKTKRPIGDSKTTALTCFLYVYPASCMQTSLDSLPWPANAPQLN